MFTASPIMGKFVAMNRKYSDEQIKEMKLLRGKGLLLKDIGSRFNCSHQAVSRLVGRPEVSESRRRLRRETYRMKQRDHRRLTQLNSGDKVFRHILKRDRPDSCELCSKPRDRLEWHHWDDQHPELGMWLCVRCHSGAEFVEQCKHNKYLEMKESYAAASH